VRLRRRIRWALGNQRGVGPALAAVEGFVADTIREFAGELVPADAFARGQIREGGLPADGFGAAGAEMPSSTPEGHCDGGQEHRQHREEEAEKNNMT